MDFKELPDMSSAYQEILEKSKKDKDRWQDDDGDGKWYEKSDTDGKISKREKEEKKKNQKEEVEDVEEAVYGGAKKEKKDTRLTVTNADKKANTKAYQNYKAGNKAYKAADHLKNEEKSEELRATGVFTEEEIAKIVEADCLGKIEESEKLAQKAYKRAQELGAKRRSKQGVNRGVGKSERAGYNLAQSQRSRNTDAATQAGNQTGGGAKSFGFAKNKSNPVKSKSTGDTSQIGHERKRDEKTDVGKSGKKLKTPKYKLSATQRATHHTRDSYNRKDPAKNPKHTAHKKEAFYFTDEELENLNELYAFTDEQLVCFFEEIIYEIAEDEDDLLEICEALEEVEILDEATSLHSARPNVAVQKPKNVDLGKDKGAEARERLKSKKTSSDSKPEPKRSDRLRAGLKKAGSLVKKGIKAAGKAVAKNTGKAFGEYQAARIKQKRAAMSRPTKQNTDKPEKKDNDGTGGKLDKLLSDVKGKRSDSSSTTTRKVVKKKVVKRSSSSGETRKAVGGALKAVGRLVKKGVKKAVGKTSRLISKGSDKLASRLGEDYDKIAHLYESGLFPIEEIETIIEEMHNVNV